MPRPRQPDVTLICLICSKPFKARFKARNRKKYCGKDCTHAARVQNTKRQFQEASSRIEHANRIKRAYENPANRKIASEAAKRRYQDPEQKQLAVDLMKDRWNDSIFRKKRCVDASINAYYSWCGGKAGNEYARLLESCGFQREYVVQWGLKKGERFKLDFAEPKLKINIELDGPHHKSTPYKDWERDQVLKNYLGWIVIRIPHDR